MYSHKICVNWNERELMGGKCHQLDGTSHTGSGFFFNRENLSNLASWGILKEKKSGNPHPAKSAEF